jgi:transposase-like protein
MNELSEGANSPVAPASSRPQRPPASAAEKAEWIKRFHESGLSLRQFSTQHSVSLMSICRWVNQAKEPQAHPGAIEFEEVKLPSPINKKWAAELTLANGTVLRLSREVPAAMLEQLLRVC